MSVQMLGYPFLLISLFFESFLIVTLLSKPAREARKRAPARTDGTQALPSVAVIVPCLNEGETVAATADSLLALDYPRELLQIILVDNGSTDDTPAVMARYRTHPQIQILNVAERGKHHAVNAGIAATDAEFVGCLDADSFVEPEALREIVPCFSTPKVAATTAAMSVHRPKTLLEHMQNAEYIFGITFRHAIASVNGLYVTPGPFSFYRRSTVLELGGFRHGHLTEDMEMALRIQRAGYEIENAPRARVYTKAPKTLLKLIKQRTRWTTGFLRNVLGEYRGLIGRREHGALGMLVLPFAIAAIVSGMLLFCIALFELLKSLFAAVSIRAGIPLAYALTPHGSFGWFYLPASLYMLLGTATVLASLILIAFGKRLSQAPGNLVLGLFSYTLLYGLIVPLWLMRATADVTLGKQRRWR